MGVGFLIDINMLDGPQELKAPDPKMSVMISFFISPTAVDSSNVRCSRECGGGHSRTLSPGQVP